MHACLLLGGRCVVALVFAVSALAKLRAPGDFASALRAMAVVPRRLNRPVVIAVPLVEAAVALLVWLPGPVATWAFAAAGGLLALFAAVLVSVLWRRIDVSCPCFGAAGVPVGRAHVVRNLLLAGVAAAGLVASTAPDPGGLEPAAVALVLLVAVGASALAIATDTLVELFSPAR
ncbi:MauE/DoxX family redox-associated membrane protein [Streptomyces sp. BE303]|uniref:MauE/DoxX family redox-associated membrane protein n=1 Tax=Streptomycetaceae TaxID=2062 RepID=UPI002E7645D0|nr:MauE/DoxX family redox-associated membrane protein [Streptomyces sp. BE303]MED7955121.1 hypothetical protein [Streptomyces sp. BE303]